MNDIWNLDVIYPGFDSPDFDHDFKSLEVLAKEFADFSGQLETQDALDGLRRGISYMERIGELGSKLTHYAILRQSANTRDSQAGSQLGRIMGVLSGTAAPEAAFRAWAAKRADLMELAEQDEVLKQDRFLLKTIAQSGRYLLSNQGEEIMAKMTLSGGNAWEQLQQHLTSTVPVRYQGTTTNLPAIRNLAYDPDPQVRKEAYEAELGCYDRIKDAVAFALNSLKLETITDCELRGYDSALDRTLKQAYMSRQTLDAMLGAMDEYLPKFRQYLKAKAKALGHENGLPWYDLFAPMGSCSTRFTTEQARDYLVEHFASFDQELADMVARAFDEEWIDFYPRDGKTGGAFCSNLLPGLGYSRILTNFDGTFSDVVTLAHELGHAFHNHCIRDHRFLNQDYSMPLAETASTFNECLIKEAAIAGCADRSEKLALIESQLQDTTQIIVDIYSRYRFEDAVIAKRPEQFMDADTLCAMMIQAQKESYGDGLDANRMHPYMWVCKSHYYGPTYYNFPYAFGGLFARGLYAQYEKEGTAFVPKYKKLLHTTTVATAEDVAKVADIDLTDKEFWRGALQTVAEQIDLFCEIVEEEYGK